ncbi:hypothetical protein ACN9JG_16565 (plasmid) [Cereibacter azotoformans]|uniref:hypothetical protein n=1 Tax=Cereibacter azotoformans TaxID=43057 RepID=UPI003B215E7A
MGGLHRRASLARRPAGRGDVDSGTFSVAAVIAARPDLAILAAWQFNALGEGVQQIEAAGIPVVAIDCNAQICPPESASIGPRARAGR